MSDREKRIKIKKTEGLKGKILQFEQPGDFFYKRGLDMADKNNLFDAMQQYRRALEKEPDDVEIKLAIAELLTEMNRFEDSNKILLLLISAKDEEKYSEMFFGMGCNFFGMQEYARADDSLNFYISDDPEGEFVYDALDMLDVIEDNGLVPDAENGVLVALDPKETAYRSTERGREYLEREEYDKAIESFRAALEKDTNMVRARNYLTIAHICKRDFDAGLKEVEKALTLDPINMSAMCNRAMIYSARHDAEKTTEAADELERLDSQDTDELARKTLVLMELGRFESAFKVAQRLLNYYPYDTITIHRYAVCAYETGRFKKAVECYEKLLKIDSSDTIARFYRGVCRAAAAGGDKRRMMMCNYQVPFDEMLARVNRMNDYLNRTSEEMRELWESGELYSLIEWGFTLADSSIKRAMLTLAASFADKKAESLLRTFALSRKQSDELVGEAFDQLKRMGAAEPYLGYIRGELVESKVSVAETVLSKIPKSYREALELALSKMGRKRSEDCVFEFLRLWTEYISAMKGNIPRQNKPQATALVAAMEYNACVACGVQATKTEICKSYGVTKIRFQNAISKLERAKEKNEIHSDM